MFTGVQGEKLIMEFVSQDVVRNAVSDIKYGGKVLHWDGKNGCSPLEDLVLLIGIERTPLGTNPSSSVNLRCKL